MEIHNFSDKGLTDYHSKVDTSRPFTSVKEAVAIFGERFLVGEIYSPKPNYTAVPKQELWKFSPSPMKLKAHGDDDDRALTNTVKKLEAELEETKKELKLLKERESETEVALAALNAELHKNMSKLAKAEAATAAKAAMTRSAPVSRRGSTEEDGLREEERKRDLFVKMEQSPTLAQILSIGEAQGYFGGKKERKMMKKKPIIPLVGDLFSRKKGSSAARRSPLYSTPQAYFG